MCSMGLDFSHCSASWAYSSFDEFRKRLAKAAGIRLRSMKGYGGKRPWSEIFDPIAILLNHPDCEGHIPPQCCAALARRLQEIVSDWPANDFDRMNANELVQGLQQAAMLHQPLVFR